MNAMLRNGGSAGRRASSRRGVRAGPGPRRSQLSVVGTGRLLMRARKEVNVQDLLRRWVFAMKPAGGVRISIDVDPYGLCR